MKDNTPRKGDRALVIPDPDGHSGLRHFDNTIVEVLSDPMMCLTWSDTRCLYGLHNVIAHGDVEGDDIVHPTRLLLKIHPDDDSKEMFGEFETGTQQHAHT